MTPTSKDLESSNTKILPKETVGIMQECHSASNHEIQPTDLHLIQVMTFHSEISEAQNCLTFYKHKVLSYTVQTAQVHIFTQFIKICKWTWTDNIWLSVSFMLVILQLLLWLLALMMTQILRQHPAKQLKKHGYPTAGH